jgi:hypothetical protein
MTKKSATADSNRNLALNNVIEEHICFISFILIIFSIFDLFWQILIISMKNLNAKVLIRTNSQNIEKVSIF